MVPNKSCFISYKSVSGLSICIGNNSYVPVLGCGTAIFALNGKQILAISYTFRVWLLIFTVYAPTSPSGAVVSSAQGSWASLSISLPLSPPLIWPWTATFCLILLAILLHCKQSTMFNLDALQPHTHLKSLRLYLPPLLPGLSSGNWTQWQPSISSNVCAAHPIFLWASKQTWHWLPVHAPQKFNQCRPLFDFIYSTTTPLIINSTSLGSQYWTYFRPYPQTCDPTNSQLVFFLPCPCRTLPSLLTILALPSLQFGREILQMHPTQRPIGLQRRLSHPGLLEV